MAGGAWCCVAWRGLCPVKWCSVERKRMMGVFMRGIISQAVLVFVVCGCSGGTYGGGRCLGSEVVIALY